MIKIKIEVDAKNVVKAVNSGKLKLAKLLSRAGAKLEHTAQKIAKEAK